MKKHLFFAAALFALAACNNDENLPTDDPNAPVEICLSSGIEVQTRATHNLDEALKEGETVHVWVDDAKDKQTVVTKENLCVNNIFTVEAGGGLSPDAAQGGETMYFPETGNNVNIYAIHGNLAEETNYTDFWGTALTHTVEQDQRSSVTTAGEGYAVSDLVYAKNTGVSRNGNPTTVDLTFRHLLSKVEVVLVQGAGNPNVEKVEILNTKLNAEFPPSKTDDFEVIAKGEITDANPIVIDNGTTTAEDAAKTDTDEGKVLNEAVIVPQTLTGETEFIRLTTTAGGVLVYKIPTEGKTFDPGKKYRYTITANLTELEVTASIEPWGYDDSITGDAEME